MSNMQYSTANITAILGEEVIDIQSSYTQVSKQEVERACKTDRACDITLVVQQEMDTMMHVVVQYFDKEITLIDGLAQTMYGSYGPDVYSLFKFHVEDKVNTTIMLESKRGYFEFFVNIVNDTDYKMGWVDMFPTRSNHQY